MACVFCRGCVARWFILFVCLFVPPLGRAEVRSSHPPEHALEPKIMLEATLLSPLARPRDRRCVKDWRLFCTRLACAPFFGPCCFLLGCLSGLFCVLMAVSLELSPAHTLSLIHI